MHLFTIGSTHTQSPTFCLFLASKKGHERTFAGCSALFPSLDRLSSKWKKNTLNHPDRNDRLLMANQADALCLSLLPGERSETQGESNWGAISLSEIHSKRQSQTNLTPPALLVVQRETGWEPLLSYLLQTCAQPDQRAPANQYLWKHVLHTTSNKSLYIQIKYFSNWILKTTCNGYDELFMTSFVYNIFMLLKLIKPQLEISNMVLFPCSTSALSLSHFSSDGGSIFQVPPHSRMLNSSTARLIALPLSPLMFL